MPIITRATGTNLKPVKGRRFEQEEIQKLKKNAVQCSCYHKTIEMNA